MARHATSNRPRDIVQWTCSIRYFHCAGREHCVRTVILRWISEACGKGCGCLRYIGDDSCAEMKRKTQRENKKRRSHSDCMYGVLIRTSVLISIRHVMDCWLYSCRLVWLVIAHNCTACSFAAVHTHTCDGWCRVQSTVLQWPKLTRSAQFHSVLIARTDFPVLPVTTCQFTQTVLNIAPWPSKMTRERRHREAPYYETWIDAVPDGSNIHSVSKNAPTLASCSFDKRGLILIIFGKRHQHTFKSDAPVRLSLSVDVYWVYLLLNSSQWNDAMQTLLGVRK